MVPPAGTLVLEAGNEIVVAEEEAPPAPPPAPKVIYSQSMPFLVKRPQLAGYVGDAGFDPVGFSEIFPMVRRVPDAAGFPPPPPRPNRAGHARLIVLTHPQHLKSGCKRYEINYEPESSRSSSCACHPALL